MQKFCYKCGKSPDDKVQLIQNLCPQCYTKLHPLLKFPRSLHIKLCKKCYRYFFKNRWISSFYDNLEDIINHVLKETIPTQLKISPSTRLEIKPDIMTNIESIVKRNWLQIEISATGKSHETLPPHTEIYKAQKVTITFTICPFCLSLKRGDYQAVLHVLAPKRALTDYERDYVFSLIEEESRKSLKIDYKAYISKYTIKKGKISFFIGSEKFARSLASSIGYHLGGLIKETYKSGSQKIPKTIKQNKLYISIYLPSFVKGDLLWIKNSPLYVVKIQGKKVSCINLNTYEKEKIPISKLKKVEILEYADNLRQFLCFSKTEETIQLLDLHSYRIYEILNTPKYDDLKIGQNIDGFEVNGRIFLIPKPK